MRRAAAVALRKPTPSGVSFTKGTSLIGECLAENNPNQILVLDASAAAYARSLELSDDEWAALELEISHGLARPDAVQLAQKYGQVIGLVVQDQNTGEAIGCVTISVQANEWPELQVIRRKFFRRELVALAEYAALALAK